MTQLRARWVFPGSGPPWRDAVLSIDGGRIVSLSSGPAPEAIDLGDAAIVPGLINAHTHLEFSHLPAPVEPRGEFAAWIRAVIASRGERPRPVADSVQFGLQESLQSGVTSLAEIATVDWPREATPPPAPRCLVFREILGLRAAGVDEQMSAAVAFLQAARAAGWQDLGISPHAPYSLHPRLFEKLCGLARRERLPVAMHLAESSAELQLLQEGRGPLVDLLSDFQLWRPGVIPVGTRPLDYLRRLAAAPRALVIHGNLLDDEEQDFLASQPQMSVVYCPRTHAAMQTGRHPWHELLRRGVNVALGTDSRASNPDLSLWSEARFLAARHPDVPTAELLDLVTTRPAQAFGWTDCGRLQAGLRADLCVIRLPPEAAADPQRLFTGAVARVMAGGRWLDSTRSTSDCTTTETRRSM